MSKRRQKHTRRVTQINTHATQVDTHAAQVDTRAVQADEFFKESKSTFGNHYEVTRQPYVLIAKKMLETLVDKERMDPEKALLILRSPSEFAEWLSVAEKDYKDREDQKIHEQMKKIAHGTHWGIAVAIGFAFLAAGPFASALLQPIADELLKRQPAAQDQKAAQAQTVQNITNNVYNFFAAEATHVPALPPATAKTDDKPKTTLTCKNVSVDAYKASLLELLQRGDVVTLETNGKKVSMCYRPNVQPMTQQHALSQK